jgi:hypothetical protein
MRSLDGGQRSGMTQRFDRFRGEVDGHKNTMGLHGPKLGRNPPAE